MIPINLIFYLGIALILGFLLGKATNWLKLTAIVGYIIAGIILGPITHIFIEDTLDTGVINIIVDVTLGLVGFIIGVGFTKGFLKRYGKMAIGIAIIQCTITFLIIIIGIFIITKNMSISLILGVIGLATAPAGTVAAIHLVGGHGKLSKMTIAVVGIDDGIAIIYFVFVLAIVKILLGLDILADNFLYQPIIELGGAIFLGIIFGGAMALLSKKIRHREDVFIIAIGLLLTCIGICEIINSSSILACMVFGIVFINIEPGIGRITTNTFETLIPPLYVLFFAIAGLELTLQYNSIIEYGMIISILIAIVYIVYRILGKLSGAIIAGKFLKAPTVIQKYLGFALLSQAGVAIGLAIYASNELSEINSEMNIGALIITIVTLTTIFFEIIGPMGVKYALTRADEARE